MIVKYNRTNHDFQIAYFIAGSCHTPDAAYISLVGLRNDREMALKQKEVTDLRTQAGRLRAQKKIESTDPIEQLEGKADLTEIENLNTMQEDLFKATEDELAFINKCITELQPYRKYGHLTDAECAESCQYEEWALELKERAENYLLTQGTIPHDHFITMRRHPEFGTMILPHIEKLQIAMAEPDGCRSLLLETKKEYDLPKLLGIEEK